MAGWNNQTSLHPQPPNTAHPHKKTCNSSNSGAFPQNNPFGLSARLLKELPHSSIYQELKDQVKAAITRRVFIQWNTQGTGPRPHGDGWEDWLSTTTHNETEELISDGVTGHADLPAVQRLAVGTAPIILHGGGIGASAADIKSGAEELQQRALEYCKTSCQADAVNWAADLIGKPVPGKTDEIKWRRVADPAWWRRQIRRHLRPAREQVWMAIAPTKIRHASPDGLKEHATAQEEVEKYKQNHEVEGVDPMTGEIFTINLPSRQKAELQRYAELMARAKGIGTLAGEKGLDMVKLVTLTVPSYMHCTTSQGGRRRENPDWDGTTPGRAHNWAQARWQRFRAAMQRRAIELEFIITAQPHKDGTPHYHAVMWSKSEDWAEIEKVLRRAYEAEKAHGADRFKHGLKFDRIKGGTEGAVAYVSRAIAYISRALGDDAPEKDKQEAVEQSAWASIWSIKRYRTSHDQVTLWRLLRRPDLNAGLAGQDAAEAKQAAERGDYALFLKGIAAARMKIAKQTAINKYGEEVQKVAGIKVGGLTITPSTIWTIKAKEKEQSTVIVKEPRGTQTHAHHPAPQKIPTATRRTDGKNHTIPAAPRPKLPLLRRPAPPTTPGPNPEMEEAMPKQRPGTLQPDDAAISTP